MKFLLKRLYAEKGEKAKGAFDKAPSDYLK